LKPDKESIYTQLLVVRSQRGDREALGQLIQLWQQRLFYYIRRLVETEEDAWDVLQECWFKLHRDLLKLRQPTCFAAWIYRIARNTAMSHLRSEFAKSGINEGKENPSLDDGNCGGCQLEEAQRVHYGLCKLSLPHREVLTLHFLEDLSIKEIAEVVGVPPGTVKSRLFHAKRLLREILEKEDKRHG